MMQRKQHTLREIDKILQTIEIRIATGDTVAQACQELQISPATYYLWRKDYGGLTPHQLDQFDALEQNVAELKRQVRQLSQDNAILKEALRVTGSLTPAQKRDIVRVIQERLDVSERRACTALSQPRCTQRYKPHP
jgi:putative transposase